MLKINTQICYRPIANEFIQIKVSNSLTFETTFLISCYHCGKKLILFNRQRGPKLSVDVSKATESVTTRAQVGTNTSCPLCSDDQPIHQETETKGNWAQSWSSVQECISTQQISPCQGNTETWQVGKQAQKANNSSRVTSRSVIQQETGAALLSINQRHFLAAAKNTTLKHWEL